MRIFFILLLIYFRNSHKMSEFISKWPASHNWHSNKTRKLFFPVPAWFPLTTPLLFLIFWKFSLSICADLWFSVWFGTNSPLMNMPDMRLKQTSISITYQFYYLFVETWPDTSPVFGIISLPKTGISRLLCGILLLSIDKIRWIWLGIIVHNMISAYK